MVPQTRSKINTTGIKVNLRSAFFTTSRVFDVKKSPPGMNPKRTYNNGKKIHTIIISEKSTNIMFCVRAKVKSDCSENTLNMKI